MIKVQDLTPEIYYKQSRDFQFIGRLYDLVLNSVKTNADILYNLPLNEDSPDNIADLLSLTLGFKVKHHYTAKQLKLLCSVLPLALKNKGSISAMMTVANALINAEGCSQPLEYDLEENNTILNLYLPPDVRDTTLLADIFDYVLPAGMSCNIIKQIVFEHSANTPIATTDTIKFYNGDGIGKEEAVYWDQSNIASDLLKIDGDTVERINDVSITDDDAAIDNINVYKPNTN